MNEWEGKNVLIFFDRKQEKDFRYQGKVISETEESIILDDIKEGEMTLAKNRIVSIKEVEQ